MFCGLVGLAGSFSALKIILRGNVRFKLKRLVFKTRGCKFICDRLVEILPDSQGTLQPNARKIIVNLQNKRPAT